MDAGLVVVIASAAVAVGTAFGLRTRVPAPVSVVLLTLASAALAWGGLMLRPDPTTVETVLAVGGMAVLGPAHVRIVLGPFGPPARA